MEERSSHSDYIAHKLSDGTSDEEFSRVSESYLQNKGSEENSDLNPVVIAWVMNRPYNRLYCYSGEKRSSITSTVK